MMNDNPTLSKSRNRTVDVFAVQCEKCFKWRVIPSQEEFEEIRSKFIEDPFSCNKISGFSCDDPADIEYDNTRTWVIDKPNLPKTPEGFHRGLVMRRDFSKLDAYYLTPTGKKLRASTEMAQFLNEHPQYQGLSVSDFSFAAPKVMEDTIPEDVERKGSTSGTKKAKTSTMEEEDDA